jgi:hypothetical protein
MNFCRKRKVLCGKCAGEKHMNHDTRENNNENQSCLYWNLKINLISNLSTSCRHVRRNVGASCREAVWGIQFGISLRVQAYFQSPSRRSNLFLPQRCWCSGFSKWITAGAKVSVGSFLRKTFSVIICRRLSSFPFSFALIKSGTKRKSWFE